ncbi:response regulator [Paracoccus sp. Z330]|uniref:Response regulator n=1 Tax=Paracoccus onchidii TaxID=3017813 RepID=A0ABT4ZK13_9RHOB|nr:response regulator [Paracoccus onchidii]MDB6179658.1 response regulator [Paracoccus onchidii]
MKGAIVHLVDDDPTVLKALGRLFSAAGIECRLHAGGYAFLGAFNPEHPSCAIVDLQMPGLDGLELQEKLSGMDIQVPLIFLTGKGDIDSGVAAIKAGAVDFLTKPVDGDRLLAVVEQALAQGEKDRVERRDRAAVNARLDRLTPRERQVLDLVVEGHLNKEIAARLGTAEKTIKVHRGRMMQKMEARNLAELIGLIVTQRTTAT